MIAMDLAKPLRSEKHHGRSVQVYRCADCGTETRVFATVAASGGKMNCSRCECRFSRALFLIQKSRDTTRMSIPLFAEMERAIEFYLKGGHSPESAAKLAAEEVFPVL